MPEFIEREALIKAVRIMPRTIRPELVRYSTVQAIIDKQPAADVVEVVRCKDCEYAKEYKNKLFCCYYPTTPESISSNDFCSYGIRKDGDGE